MPPRTTMEPQRISSIKDSLKEMSMEELQEMSESLHDLIHVLYTRQVAVEDAILDRLEYAFIRWILKKKSGTKDFFVWRTKCPRGVLTRLQKLGVFLLKIKE